MMCVIDDHVTVFSIPLHRWTCGLISHPRGRVGSGRVGSSRIGSDQNGSVRVKSGRN